VGHEFDLSLCGQSERRIQRRQAWEAKRQDAEMQRQAERLAATDDPMILAIEGQGELRASVSRIRIANGTTFRS